MFGNTFQRPIVLAITLIITFTSTVMQAQTIKGIVKETGGDTLEFGLVFLLSKDSTIIEYTSIEQGGKYSLSVKKEGEYILKAQVMGYHPYATSIDVSKESSILIKNIELQPNPQMLEEVAVTSVYRGVSHQNDTIRYKVGQFIDRSELTLGDVLKKLPGIEVDRKGNIKAQGKDVSKVLIDGRDHFDNNTQLATKNISANLVETIEVLHNYSEYSLLDGFTSHEQTVLNVGVKDGMYGKISGTINAGGGYKERLYGKSDIMSLNSTHMLSFLTSANNIGEAVFSMEDYFRLQGGMSESLGKSGEIKMTNEEQNLLFPKSNTYSNNSGLTALNISYQPSSRFKLNSYALINGGRNKAWEENHYQYIYPNASSSENAYSNNKQKLFAGYAKLEYKPKENTIIGYKGNTSYAHLKEIFDYKYSSEADIFDAQEISKGTPFRTNHQMTLIQGVADHVLQVNGRLNYHRIGSQLHYIKSNTIPLDVTLNDDYTHDQSYLNKQFTLDGSAMLYYRLKKGFFLLPSLSWQKRDEKILKENIELQTIQNTAFSLSSSLIKNNGKIQYKIGTALHRYSFNNIYSNTPTDIQKWFITPYAELSFVFSPKHKLTANFETSINPFSGNELGRYDKVLSYKAIQKGSKVSKLYSRQTQYGLNYNYYEAYSDIMLILFGVYQRESNSIAFNYHQEGAISNLYPLDSPPIDNFHFNAQMIKGLGFIPWRFSLLGYLNSSKGYSYIENEANRLHQKKISTSLSLVSRYKSAINFDFHADVDYRQIKATLSRDVQYYTTKFGGIAKLNLLKGKLAMDTGIDYVSMNIPNNKYQYWDLSLNYRYNYSSKLSFSIKGKNLLNMNDFHWNEFSSIGNYEMRRSYKKIPGNLLFMVRYSF